MGKVVQFNNHRPFDHADTPNCEDHHALLLECEKWKAVLVGMLEGFQEMKEMISEHDKRRRINSDEIW